MQNQVLIEEYSSRDRTQYVVLIGAASALLATARWLTPAANGWGTHQQLGLPPCFFHQMMGIPCPTCGMTTSFAHTVRLHFYDAFVAQPFGFLACLITASLIPSSLLLMRRRVPWMRLMTARGSNAVMYALIVLFLAAWVYKIWAMRG